MKNENYKGKEQAHLNDSVLNLPSTYSDLSTNQAQSSTSVKSKKSNNLISTIVKKAIRRKSRTESIIDNSAHPSDEKFPYDFTPSELELDSIQESVDDFKKIVGCIPPESYEKNELKTVTSDSDSAITIDPNKRNRNFLKKFLRKNISEETIKPEQRTFKKIVELHDIKTSTTGIQVNKMDFEDSQNTVSLLKSPLPNNISGAVKVIEEFSSNIRDSESNLIEMFHKFIKNPQVKDQLIDALSQHSKLQWEAERKANALTVDMWMHQIETGKKQEKSLYDTLRATVKQNRQLQIDNEILMNKQEKLLKSLKEYEGKHKANDQETMEFKEKTEKLKNKIAIYANKIEELERELRISREQNDLLTDKLKKSKIQLEDLIHTDAEYCSMNLIDEYETMESLIKDIEAIREKFELRFNTDLVKNRSSADFVIDVINICKCCITELAKDLSSANHQINHYEKDVQQLRETNARLQDNLQKSATELNSLSKKLEEKSSNDADRFAMEKQLHSLEKDKASLQETCNKLKEKYEDELGKNESLTEQIKEKNKLLEESKMFITNVTGENYALRAQVDGLNKVLRDSGSGDVERELATTQEQMSYYQTQYYQVLNEKQFVEEQLKVLKCDNAVLMEYQQNYFQHLQSQSKEIETLTKENEALKQQYEAEHKTVLSLQNERMKYLEEKNTLKTIFQHMKSEISRVERLEGTVADISKEANRLTLIAEYNKQIGDKLKSEVAERDNKIMELKSTVEKLNNIQIQNTKEKLSLCYELSEICNVKDQLKTVLNLEVKKNVHLDETKKEFESSATNQIKKYEEIYRNEREALKDLLKDFKIVVLHREQLQKVTDKVKKDNTILKERLQEQIKKAEAVHLQNVEKGMEITALSNKLSEFEGHVKKMEEKVIADATKYESNINQLEKLIRQLRKENEELTNSVKYLQNNTQKLHNDLNEARKNEKESKDSLNKQAALSNELEAALKKNQKELEILRTEKDKLINEIEYLNNLCEKVLSDFEINIKNTQEKENSYQRDLEAGKSMLNAHLTDIQRLQTEIRDKEEIIKNITSEKEILKENYDLVKQKLNQANKRLDDFEARANYLVSIEKDFAALQEEHSKTTETLQEVLQETHVLKNRVQTLLQEKAEDKQSFQASIDETLSQYNGTKADMQKELVSLSKKLSEVSKKLDNERSAYTTLSQLHKDISAKFLASIKQLVTEKNFKQELEKKLQEAVACKESLEMEKETLQKQINALTESLNKERNNNYSLLKEKMKVQTDLDSFNGQFTELLRNCEALENEVKQLHEKLKLEHSKATTEEYDSLIEKNNRLKNELETSHKEILFLRETIAQLEQKITAVEFLKCELTLRLHETQGKLETEHKICEQTKLCNRRILSEVLKMKEEGKVDFSDNILFNLVEGQNENEEHNLTIPLSS